MPTIEQLSEATARISPCLIEYYTEYCSEQPFMKRLSVTENDNLSQKNNWPSRTGECLKDRTVKYIVCLTNSYSNLSFRIFRLLIILLFATMVAICTRLFDCWVSARLEQISADAEFDNDIHCYHQRTYVGLLQLLKFCSSYWTLLLKRNSCWCSAFAFSPRSSGLHHSVQLLMFCPFIIYSDCNPWVVAYLFDRVRSWYGHRVPNSVPDLGREGAEKA